MKLLFVAALALFLGACTAGVPSNFKADGQKIAVLSFAGARFNALENTMPDIDSVRRQIDSLNMTQPLWDRQPGMDKVFANSQMIRWQHDTVDWGVDADAVAAAAALLAPKYQIVPFSYAPADFKGDGFYAIDAEEITAAAAAAIRKQPAFPAATGVDAYVVLVPGAWQPTRFPRFSFGMGITKDFELLNNGQPLLLPDYMLHVFYNVLVLDGRSLERVALSDARYEPPYDWPFKGHPGKFVDIGYWSSSYATLSAAQRQMIADDVKGMIRATLPRTLQQLDLLP